MSTNIEKIKTRVVSKHDSEANWSKAENFIPMAGEVIIYDADDQHLLPRIKIGDGKKTVNALDFVTKELEDNLDGLISCGTADPDIAATGKFYFKYSE
jgi:hypothetical protein